MVVAEATWVLTGGQVALRLVHEGGHGRLEQRDLEAMGRSTRGPLRVEASEERRSRVQPGDDVGEGGSHLHWRALVAPGYRHQARSRLGEQVKGGGVAQWPARGRSEERRVGKECRSRWSPSH